MEPFMHMKTMNTLSGSISEIRGQGRRQKPASSCSIQRPHPDRPEEGSHSAYPTKPVPESSQHPRAGAGTPSPLGLSVREKPGDPGSKGSLSSGDILSDEMISRELFLGNLGTRRNHETGLTGASGEAERRGGTRGKWWRVSRQWHLRRLLFNSQCSGKRSRVDTGSTWARNWSWDKRERLPARRHFLWAEQKRRAGGGETEKRKLHKKQHSDFSQEWALGLKWQCCLAFASTIPVCVPRQWGWQTVGMGMQGHRWNKIDCKMTIAKERMEAA